MSKKPVHNLPRYSQRMYKNPLNAAVVNNIVLNGSQGVIGSKCLNKIKHDRKLNENKISFKIGHVLYHTFQKPRRQQIHAKRDP